jgi:hypothetical protein
LQQSVGCWLFSELWKQLQLDEFWRVRLGYSREGTDWEHVLQTLVCYRLLDPGSEWRLHRVWYEQSAMGDLLAEDFSIAAKDTLYRCLDSLLEHKAELFDFLHQRWAALFGANFDVLLYDLTSTYFESDPPFPEGDKRQFGYSRDKRSDCVQVVIALIITPEGFMDRGIPTEEVLAEMRGSDPPIRYLVGTPKGRLTKLEAELLPLEWQRAKEGVDVKLLPREGELYVLARSNDRLAKERAMRRRQLKKLWARLKELQQGSGANFDRCMLLSGEGLCRFHAASTAAQVSGAVVAFPVSGLRLNCCFLIFSASSMPRIVTAAVSNRLNPSIGLTRCFIRRWSCSTTLFK